MEYREKSYWEYMANAKEAVRLMQSESINVDADDVWQILIYELDSWQIPTEILFKGLDSGKIRNIVKDYYSKYGKVVGKVVLYESALPDELSRDDLEKANVQFDGEIWVVYKYDKDCFPSNPHAHNYDKHVKLDLGSGDLYRGKAIVGAMRRKQLLTLRAMIEERITGIRLPKLKG